MFCRKCGAEMEEGARFCGSCGAPAGHSVAGANTQQGTNTWSGANAQQGSNVQQGSNAQQGGTQPGMRLQPGMNARPGGSAQGAPYKKGGMPKGAVIAIIVVVVLALIGCGLFFGSKLLGSRIGSGITGRSYQKTIDQFCESISDGDVEELVDLIPEDAIVYMMKANGYSGSDKELLDQADQMFQDELGDTYGGLVGLALEMSGEITDTEDIKGEDLSDLKNEYKEMDVKVSAAKNVTVDFTMEAFGQESSTTQTLTLIKVGRSWYLEVNSLVGML